MVKLVRLLVKKLFLTGCIFIYFLVNHDFELLCFSHNIIFSLQLGFKIKLFGYEIE
jgi:hypothetical protein